MIYQIIVEKWDEDIDIVDEFDTLEDAMKKAKAIKYKYKAIWIEQLDEEDYSMIKEIEVD